MNEYKGIIYGPTDFFIYIFQGLIHSTRVQLYLSNFNILWPLQDNTGGSRSNKTASFFFVYIPFTGITKKYQLGMNSDFLFFFLQKL